MLSLREFWRRHRRKILIIAGAAGSGYLLYRLYNAHRQSLAYLERQLASERAKEDLVRSQMQAHFENIQRIAETTTLPHALRSLSNRIAEELDHSSLIENLTSSSSQLSYSDKLELWDRLKLLSFSRLVVSIWAMIMITLYIRVQVNILGRHLYIDIAQEFRSSDTHDDLDFVGWDDQQKFLSSVDFLCNDGLLGLISGIQSAVTEVLKGKHLKDSFNNAALLDTIMEIVYTFMGTGRPHQWVDYMMLENEMFQRLPSDAIVSDAASSDSTRFKAYMGEARAVLVSAEFREVMGACLKALVNAVVCDMMVRFPNNSLASGMPLVKLLPRVAQMGAPLLDELSQNQYIDIIRGIPEVELFFSILYSNLPAI